ncbi:sulfite exporter TauE/SafE family protein 3-like [Ipomoea triloba]|uniref:sulfite exporter TauE/SafE family protein 3-like n=1 Tax=Ipomoea triloba TaxID=35885 RepID=UPI00125D6886|nr:sulfite exporter TauE/SafE family protein 3-like [Ipomoea triloba]
MAETGSRFKAFVTVIAVLAFAFLSIAFAEASAELRHHKNILRNHGTTEEEEEEKGFRSGYVFELLNSLLEAGQAVYRHVWPDLEFGWRIVLGSVIGFFGAAFGSVGGVGGGGIFVPMLTLIIGFDAKSSTAISKCMITGAAGATVYYNLKLRHPTLDLPIIDYDLALLLQPMLLLGISIGVILNVLFSEWMVTVLLIILFLAASTKAFFKGVETWKKETIIKKEAARRLASRGVDNREGGYSLLPGGTNNASGMKQDGQKAPEVSCVENMHLKDLGVLIAVWIVILVLHIVKNYATPCSMMYWIFNASQVPVAVGASAYQAVCLYKGWRVVMSNGEVATNWKVHQLVLYCFFGILAGVVGGLLGLGGGFILGPLFLELGIPPQVSSATATFIMLFSSSMSVIQYYLLHRFPVPYAIYFVAVATIAALVGQHVVRKIISIVGRASVIVFVLAFTIFLSAISLGGVGIFNTIRKIEDGEYMGFVNICETSY